ncbi:hypothetical protein [Marinospirillum insulare]|uniref:ABC-type Zn uptake system ZnuABC, Zn-binding component ZnuA n=1 Tax=Marinospirillum insulare TaxID=217169 RepID=A0ABQ5ZTX0_9GAMM|nr:hypothetical protein [Marinospirillum insulare]GLR63606.1 hypothetical protein GCM10007878_10410 [Marinospirillum insulare]
MKLKSKLLVVIASLLILTACSVNQQTATTQPSVTTATPVTHLIASALLADTQVEVNYLPPKRLPINRIPAWLNRVGANELTTSEAVLTLESVLPDLAIFPLLRQKNIRLVAIDLAKEIAPGGAGISQRQGISEPEYFWLDSNNLLLMINIAAKDLTRLWPNYAEQISQNRQQTLRQVQQMALVVDELLFTYQINSLALTDAKLMPLAQATALPLVELDNADLVIASRANPSQKTWVVDPLTRPKVDSLEAWLEALKVSLQSALKE